MDKEKSSFQDVKGELNFDEALEALRAGKKVVRNNEFFGSKKVFLVLETKETIYIENPDGTKSVYSCPQEDILAKDWTILP